MPEAAREHRPVAADAFSITGLGGERVLDATPDGTGVRLGIVASRFNAAVVTRLVEGALGAARAAGVAPEDVVVVTVPGAFELPAAAHELAVSGQVDAIACVGAVIRGETTHYDLVATAAATGCAKVSRETGVALGFGVVTTEDLDQALARAGGDAGNKGAEAVEAALECFHLFRAIRAGARTSARRG